MKNPSLSIKQILYNTIGSTFDVEGNTVYWYTDPPQSPPDYYCWVEDNTILDLGTKQDFVSDVTMVITCVTKVSGAVYSSLLLDQIVNSVTEQIISRGQSLLGADSDFNIFSATLQDITQYDNKIGNKTELAKAIRVLFKVTEL